MSDFDNEAMDGDQHPEGQDAQPFNEHDSKTRPMITVPATVPASSLPAVRDSVPQTSAEARDAAVANLLHAAYEKASTLDLTKEEIAALQAPFPDSAFFTGAGGKENLIYIEHASLRERLHSVLDPGKWALVVRRHWSEPFTYWSKQRSRNEEGTRIYVEAVLLVRGCYAGEAIGNMDYYPNDSTNYGDAFEGAKSAALRRTCKELGIGLQAWHKEFCAGWWQRKQQAGRVAPKMPVVALEGTAKASAAPAKANVPAESLEQRKARFVAMLAPYGELAVNMMVDAGLLMPNESLSDVSATFIETLTKAKANELFQSVKAEADRQGIAPVPVEQPATPAASNPPPSEVPAAGVAPAYPTNAQRVTGTIEAVNIKTGTSAKGEWQRAGILVGQDWYSTFSKSLAATAQERKGQEVTLVFVAGERGNDLVDILWSPFP